MSSTASVLARLLLTSACIGLLTEAMPALGACSLPGHQPASKGLPPVSFPCSPRQLEQMSLETLEREQAACKAAAEARGFDCGKHKWDELAEEQEQLRVQLGEAAEAVRRAWPKFKQEYIRACQSKVIAECSAKTLNQLLSEAIGTKKPSPLPGNIVQNFADRLAAIECAMDVVAPLFIDGTACESRAGEVHSRILNYINQRKYEAEERRDYYLEMNARAKNNPECQCQRAPTTSPDETGEVQVEPDESPPSS